MNIFLFTFIKTLFPNFHEVYKKYTITFRFKILKKKKKRKRKKDCIVYVMLALCGSNLNVSTTSSTT